MTSTRTQRDEEAGRQQAEVGSTAYELSLKSDAFRAAYFARRRELKASDDARYHSITLEPDDLGEPGTFRLRFSTMPGMSTAVGELRPGDLDALARILGDRNESKTPAPGEGK